MSYKIVIDSCGELLEQWKQDERFASVPLTLTVGSENIICLLYTSGLPVGRLIYELKKMKINIRGMRK